MTVGQSEGRSLSRLCSLLGYSRQAYYKNIRNMHREAYAGELIIQEVIRLRLTQKRIGGKKLYFMLQDFMIIHCISMGRDAFFDLLRENNLLIKQRRSTKPRTTDSFHRFHKYTNLIKDMAPYMPNGLWVSDITYIVLREKFAYLSLITDAYSRKIVGFCLSESLSAWGSLEALKMALRENETNDQLIHHSDRGVQYCCNEYINLLKNSKISISMTEDGNPLDNALAERVNGILKEELLESEYEDFAQAKEAVKRAVLVYNNERIHLSLNMLTPQQAHTRKGEIKECWKNYYPLRRQKQGQVEAVQ